MRIPVGMAAVGLGMTLLAQEPQAPPRFRVAVDAVRIDAVVTDKDGAIVRDLTADDFEILQDGKRQRITSAQFVPLLAGTAPAPRGPERERPTLESTSIVGAPSLPAAGGVRREHIQRTIVLVVDDLGLSMESLYYVKRSLHEFVDNGVQPGDLVALMRTSGSIDGLQPFTTDRRVIHAAVDNLRWNVLSRSGVEAFDAVNSFPVLTADTNFGAATTAPGLTTGDFTALNAFRGEVQAAGTLGALNLMIAGTQDMPGRKAILLVTEGFGLLEQGPHETTPQPGRVRIALDRAIDRATRAGVVIYSIDARGLQTGGLNATDNFNCAPPGCSGPTFDSNVRTAAAGRNAMRRNTQEGMKYLAEQTGGFAILETNNLAGGLARAAEDVRDYYVIGYVPEEGTFATGGKTPELHKIAVRVKRPGLRVRTRKSFLGVSDTDAPEAPPSPLQAMVNAAVSPFTASDVAVRATLLPGFSPADGLFVRALLHIDASALTFVKSADGRSTASADVLGMVFDRDGTEVAHLSTGFETALTSDDARNALRDGLAYTLRVPIKKAGPYQVRFALRDRQSGHFGTAGEFIDLPDVPGGAFAVSGIVLRSDDDVSPSADKDRMMISPSQALRVYKPGARLRYACDIYNAAAPVQLTLSVWRGTQQVLSAKPDTLTPPADRSLWFSAGGGFKLGEALSPGQYVLQIAAVTADKARSGRVKRASQVMDFEVR